jgi:beta-glucosidase
MQTEHLSEGVLCTGKHFLGYAASMGGRNQAPVDIGPRELREVYAEPFAAAIREAGLASVMNSYSAVDGVPCAGSKAILTDLLRDELGLEGTVVADYFAVAQLMTAHGVAGDRASAAITALAAGLDVELPALDCFPSLSSSVESGNIPVETLDRAVLRVLRQKFELGLFEDPFVDAGRASAVFDSKQDRLVARRAAALSVCLLTNDGTLPIDAARLRRLAVIGPHADDRRLLQGDYHYPAHVEIVETMGELFRRPEGWRPGPHYTEHVTPLAGLRNTLPPLLQIDHVAGCGLFETADPTFSDATSLAAAADVAIVFVGEKSGLTMDTSVGEMRDTVSLDLPDVQRALVDAVIATGTPTVVVVISGRVHTLGDVCEQARAVLWCAPPGEEGGNGLADVLTGTVNPSGRLPISLPRHVGQLPIHHNMRARGNRSEFYGEYVDSPVSPLFAFGHGLSYTQFEYSQLEVAHGTTSDSTVISAVISNVGGREGEEVVQLYFRDEVASTVRPIRDLIGFARVLLAPGKGRRVTFVIHPSRLAYYDDQMRLVAEPGRFTFWLAASAEDVRLESTVELAGPVVEYPRTAVVPTQARIE